MSHGGYAAVRRRRGATSRIAGTAAHSATERSDVAERIRISEVAPLLNALKPQIFVILIISLNFPLLQRNLGGAKEKI
jgi:hypothetical protein